MAGGREGNTLESCLEGRYASLVSEVILGQEGCWLLPWLGRTLASKGAAFGKVERRKIGRGAGRIQERQGSRATAVGEGLAWGLLLRTSEALLLRSSEALLLRSREALLLRPVRPCS